VEIIFHSHHAAISDRMRRRAELAVERAARRLSRAVDAIVRFEQDGPMKRVEIVLHAPRQRKVVALGEARFYGLALTIAIEKLGAQVRKLGRGRQMAIHKRQMARAESGARIRRPTRAGRT
jgi:ribosome-associated translation inhibitor RaiA